MQKIMKWIAGNIEIWYKICRKGGYEFNESELFEMLKKMLRLCADHELFNIVLLVFLTEYSKELSFLADEED